MPRAAATGLAGLLALPSLATAPHAEETGGWGALVNPHSAIVNVVLIGIVMFATVLAILHIRERNLWAERERRLVAELAGMRASADRAELLTGAERQAIVEWRGPDGEAVCDGDPTIAGEGASMKRVLAIGTWVAPLDAAGLEEELGRLRERGEGFRRTVATLAGHYVEAEGRTVSGRAILRLRDVSAERAGRLAAERDGARRQTELARLHALLDAIDAPVWLRDRDGRLDWANRAYLQATEASGIEDVRVRALELLERADRAASAARREGGETFRARVAAIVAGLRRTLDITETPVGPNSGELGAGGIALDVSEIELARADLARQRQAHTRTLDQLPTAVAIFDARQHLVFHNAAYRELWKLDEAYLDAGPSDGEVLDRLRAAGRLPEQQDFRVWKTGMLDAYRALAPAETWWHLPGGRTLRVVTTPDPGGGLTYLFDDVSDRVLLESRYNALIGVQRETLDALSEGVALFGTDGRLKLSNRAFSRLWHLEAERLAGEPHVGDLVELCRPLAPETGLWSDLRSIVAGHNDMRVTRAWRVPRRDGSALDVTAEPLPDGGTLVTCADVTASVNVERALTERNDALERAAQLRNEFVHHVSYELRSPLTNVIGFTELLGAEAVGPLNERQREYAGHIMRSSGALLAIVNDILDLASIDADAIELVREPVDIVDTIEAAAKGVHDRLVEADIRLEIEAAPGIGSFVADGKRVRQILFNLLSNAAGFSSPGQTIRVTASRRRRADHEAGHDPDGFEIVLAVADEGRGIPDEMMRRVFERFETETRGTRHKGVGLGLSIVRAFVELHGGRVEIETALGRGTTVTCVFPAEGARPFELAA